MPKNSEEAVDMQYPREEFADLRHCAVFNFRKFARAVTQTYSRIMKETGLRSTQFTILGVLSHKESFTMNELASVLVMERTTLTRNLKPMEREGWIENKPGEDRRTRIISLTAEGIELLSRALPLWKEAQALVTSQWGDDYPQTLDKIEHTIRLIQETTPNI